MSYERGDIVIVPFPFVLESGNRKQKARPALIISDQNVERRYTDLILAGITSQVPNELKETELTLEATNNTGLAKQSVLKLEYLMTLPIDLISRKIGHLSKSDLRKVNKKLALSLGIPTNSKNSTIQQTLRTQRTRQTL